MEIKYIDALAALALVILAIGLARYKSISAEKEMAYGSIRAFVQLVAVGYVLEFIFNTESIWLVIMAVAAMLLVGSYTAGDRDKHTGRGFPIALISMTAGSLVTLVLMLALGIITTEARYLIPLAGMIISNSMNSSSITLERVGADLKGNRLEIETALSLGKTWQEASRRIYRNAVRAGLISILNYLKTVGIVALPGAMTGMILAGISPLKAVLLQIIVSYMLLSAVTITSLLTGELAVRRFFNKAEQFTG